MSTDLLDDEQCQDVDDTGTTNLFFSKGDLTMSELNSFQRDLTIVTGTTMIIIILFALYTQYKIVVKIIYSKTNFEKNSIDLYKWSAAIIAQFVVFLLMIFSMIFSYQYDPIFRPPVVDILLDFLVTTIFISWIYQWRESVRSMIKRRFTSTLRVGDGDKTAEKSL